MPHPSLDLVVFDMAGTTVHDADFVARAFLDTLQAAGYPATTGDANTVMGYPKPEAIRRLLIQYDGHALPSDVIRLHHDFLDRMNTFYRTSDEVREVPGARATFERLRHVGIAVALNTGFSRTTADIILDRLGWTDPSLVNATITSDEVTEGRPTATMVIALMDQLSIDDPARVAKVGDTPSDLLEGDAAGCRYNIGVTEGTHSQAELEAYPHTHLIPSVAALPSLLNL
ncbi:MAG: phosphonatase-like hydrolase [Rhodothermales bacterium]